jgi:hypothetical protein
MRAIDHVYHTLLKTSCLDSHFPEGVGEAETNNYFSKVTKSKKGRISRITGTQKTHHPNDEMGT